MFTRVGAPFRQIHVQEPLEVRNLRIEIGTKPLLLSATDLETRSVLRGDVQRLIGAAQRPVPNQP